MELVQPIRDKNKIQENELTPQQSYGVSTFAAI